VEKPNIEYIEKLARGDDSIRKTLLNVIKTEFPVEKEQYEKSVKGKKFKEIEDNVHRIKHKFSILGLESSYEKANKFEHNLREDILNTNQKEEFDKILSMISDYLKTI